MNNEIKDFEREVKLILCDLCDHNVSKEKAAIEIVDSFRTSAHALLSRFKKKWSKKGESNAKNL